MLLLFVTIVGRQLTVIVAVANPPPRPPFVLFSEAWTWKVPFAFEFSAGVNFSPALPSANVMKSLLLIWVVPSVLNNVPPVMFVILKLVTSAPSAALRLITNPDVLCVLTIVVAFVTDGVSATGLTVMVAVADPGLTPVPTPLAACTLKLKVEPGLNRFAAGVKRSPALPS